MTDDYSNVFNIMRKRGYPELRTDRDVFNATTVLKRLLVPTLLETSSRYDQIQANWSIVWLWVDALAQRWVAGAMDAADKRQQSISKCFDQVYNALDNCPDLVSSGEPSTTFTLWLRGLDPDAAQSWLSPTTQLMQKVIGRVNVYFSPTHQPCSSPAFSAMVKTAQQLVHENPDPFMKAAINHLRRVLAPAFEEKIMCREEVVQVATTCQTFDSVVAFLTRSGQVPPFWDIIPLVMVYLRQIVSQEFRQSDAEFFLRLIVWSLRILSEAANRDELADYIRLAVKHGVLHHIFAARRWIVWGSQQVDEGARENVRGVQDTIGKLIAPHFFDYVVLKASLTSLKQLPKDAYPSLRADLGDVSSAWKEMLQLAHQSEPAFADLKQSILCEGPMCPELYLVGDLKVCQGCREAFYCSKSCQRADWKLNDHRQTCISAISLYRAIGVRHPESDALLQFALSKWDSRLRTQIVLHSGNANKEHFRKLLQAYTGPSPPVIQVDYRMVPPKVEILPLDSMREMDVGGRWGAEGHVGEGEVRLVAVTVSGQHARKTTCVLRVS